jgi:RNA polymerase sigma factor (TIGR02999 family)
MNRQDPVAWADRSHFYRLAARVMKQALVDYARGHASRKRGGSVASVPLDEANVLDDPRLDAILDIDATLARLAELDERKASVFEMRFFGGFDVVDTAEALRISKNTVVRDWDFACAWLRRELSRAE